MTEPQKEYIITEDDIGKIEALSKSPYDKTNQIVNILHCRPYSSAKESSEKVLDELEALIITGLHELPPFIIPEVRQAKIDTCEWVIEKMKELRQQREQE